MICPYCHKETPDSSTFCTECGRRLKEAAPQRAAEDGSNEAQADQPVESAKPSPNDEHVDEATSDSSAATPAGAPQPPAARDGEEAEAARSGVRQRPEMPDDSESPDGGGSMASSGQTQTDAPASSGEPDEQDASAKAGAPVQPGTEAPSGAKGTSGRQANDSTDGLAVASLVCSIVGIFFLQFLLPILGIIFGAVARGRNPKDSTNGKLALAGLIVGIIVLVLTILVLIAILVLGFAVGSEAYGLVSL